ncbi:hypothetical protein BGX34_009687 [Mortierella sp. NVP85]|nr:hypothetical protein BGX34_009687 [Mortierella sp. NVP85]
MQKDSVPEKPEVIHVDLEEESFSFQVTTDIEDQWMLDDQGRSLDDEELFTSDDGLKSTGNISARSSLDPESPEPVVEMPQKHNNVSTSEYPNGNVEYHYRLVGSETIRQTQRVAWALAVYSHTTTDVENIGARYTYLKVCLGVYECEQCEFTK